MKRFNIFIPWKEGFLENLHWNKTNQQPLLMFEIISGLLLFKNIMTVYKLSEKNRGNTKVIKGNHETVFSKFTVSFLFLKFFYFNHL